MPAITMKGPYLFGLGAGYGFQYVVPINVIGYKKGILAVYLQVFPTGCKQTFYARCPDVAIKRKRRNDVHKLILCLHKFSTVNLVFTWPETHVFVNGINGHYFMVYQDLFARGMFGYHVN